MAELWTTQLLAGHAREHGPARVTPALPSWRRARGESSAGRGQPHKVRYYVECRDPDFDAKMAGVLDVYREVQSIKTAAAAAKSEPSDAVAIISYDEKPGIQAIATTSPTAPVPREHASFTRDYEYKRHGTVSLLAVRPAHGKIMPWSETAIAAANSSNSSSLPTPPIRPTRRSR